MRQVFKDSQLQARFERDGFVILPCLNDHEVKILNQEYDRLPAVPQAGFFSGIYSDSMAFKQRSNDLLAKVGKTFAQNYLQDYRVLIGNFVLKVPGLDSTMACHQDWTFVDESYYSSINVWCALTDTNNKNGALHLLPGSHRLEQNIRGTLVPPSLAIAGDIPCEDMLSVPIKAGQAIIHDHRVLHRSPPNLSEKRRLATAICMIPAEAEAVHYYQSPASNKLEIYSIDTDFFHHYTFGKNIMPSSAKFKYSMDAYHQAQFAKDTAHQLMSKWRSVHADR